MEKTVEKMRKTGFFDDSRLLKHSFASILIILMVCAPVFLHALESSPTGEDGAGVTVTIKSTDADRQREVNRHREQLARAAEAVKRLELENESLREKNAALRGELIEIREKFQKQNESFRQLQLWLAGVPAEGTVRETGQREEQLLQALAELSKSGGDLAVNAVSFCELVQTLLRELPVGKVRQAAIRLRLDELVGNARRFIALTDPEESVEEGIDPLRTCRILAVDRELSMAVLSAGSAKGVFAGMIYRVGKDRQTQLRVVGVRPHAAAAVVVEGSIADLAPGMEAVAGETKESDGSGRTVKDSKIN